MLKRNSAIQNDRSVFRRQQNRIQTRKGQGTPRRAAENSTDSDQSEFGNATLGDSNGGVRNKL